MRQIAIPIFVAMAAGALGPMVYAQNNQPASGKAEKGGGKAGGTSGARSRNGVRNPQANEAVENNKLVCKKYKNGAAKLALCELELDHFISENDRVAKVGLYLKNIGDVGVCNMALWVDGMGTDALVDYWPKWIDIQPNEGYLAPKDGFELGANVFMPSSYPQYYLTAGFHECKPPDMVPPELLPYEYCKTMGGGPDGDGVILTWCEDKLFDSWMKDDGTRVIHAQGHVTNNGTVDVCNLKFSVTDLDDASNVWPEWFPSMNSKNSPAPLRPKDLMEVGADVPSKGFRRPKITLESYKPCAFDMTTGGGSVAVDMSPLTSTPASEASKLRGHASSRPQEAEILP